MRRRVRVNERSVRGRGGWRRGRLRGQLSLAMAAGLVVTGAAIAGPGTERGAQAAVPNQPSGPSNPSDEGDEPLAPWEAAESSDFGPDGPAPATGPPPRAASTDAEVPITTQAETSIAPGLTLSEFTGSGPVEGVILTADLTEASLEPTYLYPGSVASTSVLTSQAEQADATAGVNGDFFDIGVTGAPRGVGIDDGELVNAPAGDWNESVALAPSGDGYSAWLDQVVLEGEVALPDESTVPVSNLNSPHIEGDGVGVFTSAWGDAARDTTVSDASAVREVEVTDGEVTSVDAAAGSGEIADDVEILLARDGGADQLDALEVGDPLEIEYAAAQSGDDPDVAISGNVVLASDGDVVAPDHPRHPRTAVGLDEDGTTMWLVVVQGRTDDSVGMTYVELANFMLGLGAVDALNLDGGGSTTMVARAGDGELGVVNTPSGGQQRPVPNGLGFTSTAECPLVNRDFAAYPDLATGDEGDEVRAAECLLAQAGFRPDDVDPSGAFDEEMVAAVEEFQEDRGLEVTGSIDGHTWTALLAAGDTPVLSQGDTGPAVAGVQRALTAALGRSIQIDGVFGAGTDEAVRDYQSSRGLEVDGVVGVATWEALQAGQ